MNKHKVTIVEYEAIVNDILWEDLSIDETIDKLIEMTGALEIKDLEKNIV